jgi:hypothetical protein
MSKAQLPIRLDDLKLTAKQQKFVAEYTSGGYNATEAILSSGLIAKDTSKARATLAANQLLQNPNISQAIDRLTECFIQPYRDRMQTQMIQTLQVRAYWDPSWFFNPDGTSIELDDIDPLRRQAIDKIEEKFFGKEADTRTVVYILADRDLARKELKELLGKQEKASGADTGMRSKLDELFEAAKKGIDYGRALEKKEKELDRVEAMELAQEQQTTILTPKEIMARVKNA